MVSPIAKEIKSPVQMEPQKQKKISEQGIGSYLEKDKVKHK